MVLIWPGLATTPLLLLLSPARRRCPWTRRTQTWPADRTGPAGQTQAWIWIWARSWTQAWSWSWTWVWALITYQQMTAFWVVYFHINFKTLTVNFPLPSRGSLTSFTAPQEGLLQPHIIYCSLTWFTAGSPMFTAPHKFDCKFQAIFSFFQYWKCWKKSHAIPWIIIKLSSFVFKKMQISWLHFSVAEIVTSLVHDFFFGFLPKVYCNLTRFTVTSFIYVWYFFRLSRDHIFYRLGGRTSMRWHARTNLTPSMYCVHCTYLTPSPTNCALYLSRAVEIRLRKFCLTYNHIKCVRYFMMLIHFCHIVCLCAV